MSTWEKLREEKIIERHTAKDYELMMERKRANSLIEHVLKFAYSKPTLDEKQKFWEIVKMLDDGLRTLYPNDYKKLMLYVKEIRDSQRNEFGSNQTRTIRHLAVTPVAIMGALKILYGTELPYSNKRFQREFAKRFPHYRIAQKI